MPRILTDEFNRRSNSVENLDYPVILLQIDHDALASPIRLCKDNANITSNGNVYTAISIEIQLPDDTDNSANVKSRLSIDNIGKELVSWLETAGGGRGATATLSTILRSDPDNIEISYVLDMSNISITQLRVEADLIFPDILNLPAVGVEYRPENSPALF